MKHLGTQTRRTSEVSYAAHEDAGIATCQAAKNRKRAEAASRTSVIVPAHLPAAAWSTHRPEQSLEFQPDAASSPPHEPNFQPPPTQAGISPKRASPEEPRRDSAAASGGEPAPAAYEAPTHRPSKADVLPDACSDLRREHFNRMVCRAKIWCQANGFTRNTPNLRRRPQPRTPLASSPVHQSGW